jgi:pimeloyl-ACP methyl ester carboxylesterase
LVLRIGLGHPVFVGHSMGGVIAFELAIQHPEGPVAIVMIDSPVARTEASRAGMPAFLEQLRGPDYRAAVSKYVRDGALPAHRRGATQGRDPRQHARDARHVMVGALEGMRDFDPDEGRVGVPSLFIAADDRPLSDLPHLFELAPQMLFGQTVGSGHFCTLEVPDQVNAMLAPFLALLPSLAAG